jgi:hypothetical protein
MNPYRFPACSKCEETRRSYRKVVLAVALSFTVGIYLTCVFYQYRVDMARLENSR